jgi:hypothetical protein
MLVSRHTFHCYSLLEKARPGAFCQNRPNCIPLSLRLRSSPPSFFPLPRGVTLVSWVTGVPLDGGTGRHIHARTLAPPATSTGTQAHALTHALAYAPTDKPRAQLRLCEEREYDAVLISGSCMACPVRIGVPRAARVAMLRPETWRS